MCDLSYTVKKYVTFNYILQNAGGTAGQSWLHKHINWEVKLTLWNRDFCSMFELYQKADKRKQACFTRSLGLYKYLCSPIDWWSEDCSVIHFPTRIFFAGRIELFRGPDSARGPPIGKHVILVEPKKKSLPTYPIFWGLLRQYNKKI